MIVRQKEDLISVLKGATCKYAELTIDVWRGGQLAYPNEKVIVSVLETQDPYKFFGKAYCVFDSIKDFKENSVFGAKEAREKYCNYYFGAIHRVDYKY